MGELDMAATPVPNGMLITDGKVRRPRVLNPKLAGLALHIIGPMA